MLKEVEKLKEILKQSQKIVFFGGAGVSTESGIPDFRSANGLYQTSTGKGYPPEVMLSRSFYKRHPEDFYAFYKEKMIYKEAKPNLGHLALAKLEQMGKLSAIVTQNIDGLHHEAGNEKIFELHGSVQRNFCTKCQAFYDLDYILAAQGVPKCSECGSIVKPDVVLYEEGLDDATLVGAIKAIANADTLIIGGTSLVVQPAASLIDYFKGNHLVLINKSSTPYDNRADLIIHEPIGQVLSQAVKALEEKE